MAPVDRREHRQQRVRGAGTSTVQASFGFDFGNLGAKQASLPPPRSARRSRTPVQPTPRNVNGSARRHRSLSAPRSARSQRKPTPRQPVVTPQLGKRKRGTPTAASDNPEEEDELSPDRPENAGSVEKSRRLERTTSPVAEETAETQDELSYIDEVPTTTRRTPGLVAGLIDDSRAPAISHSDASRRSKSTDIVPVTPGMQPHSSSRQSFVGSTTIENTASNASQVGDEDEDADELSPAKDSTITSKVVLRKSIPNGTPQDGEEGDVDELSPGHATASATSASIVQDTHSEVAPTPVPRRRVVPHVSPKVAGKVGAGTAVTPAKRKLDRRRIKKALVEAYTDNELSDELSPEIERTQQAPLKQTRQMRKAPTSNERSEPHKQDAEPHQESPKPSPELFAKRTSPKRTSPKRLPPKHTQRSKPPSDKPLRKRQKALGPKLAISVLRMKGHGVRGITMADTTRTILEEAIDHRLGRMLEKMQTSQDSVRRKELRSEVNLVLSFKESLSERLLDLQDANDVLTTNLKKLKIFKRENVELRRDILALQNSRQELALEHDDIQADFEAEKAKVEARNTLSANMFEIEAAIQNGRKKARQEKREHEGPDVPLSMLLETVGRDVGSLGGGLLVNVKSFNGALERAAGWLEGRA